jgi:hypothetical protein
VGFPLLGGCGPTEKEQQQEQLDSIKESPLRKKAMQDKGKIRKKDGEWTKENGDNEGGEKESAK